MKNKTRLVILVSVIAVSILAAMLFPAAIRVYAQGDVLDMGAVLDYLISPKAISGVGVVSQWRDDDVPQIINTPIPEGEDVFSGAEVPIQATLEGEREAGEYLYYVMQMEGDTSAYGMTEGEDYYWNLESGLYIGPVESDQFYTAFDINRIAPKLLAAAVDSYRINIYGLISPESNVSASTLLYNRISYSMSIDLNLEPLPVYDNALPGDLFAALPEGNAWFAHNVKRSVAAASLNFPDRDLAPGQAAGTVRLMPADFPDTYNSTTAELPTVYTLAAPGNTIGVVERSYYFDYLFDDEEPSAIQSVLDNAPGEWLKPGGDDMIAVGISILTNDGTKSIISIDEFADSPGRLQIGNIYYTADPDDRRTLGLWRYPLVLQQEVLSDDSLAYLFSLPDVPAAWTPVEIAVDYDELNHTLTADITQGGAMMPMLVATILKIDGVYPNTALTCLETEVTMEGTIPVWMGAQHLNGLTLAEAEARYEVLLIKDPVSMPLAFREVGGYAVSALDNGSVNDAFLVIPATWTETGAADIVIRDKVNSENTSTLSDAIVFEDAPPVMTLEGDAEITLELCPDDPVPTLPGATATDICDGDITDNIVVGGDMVLPEPGIYNVTYNVQDNAGNTAPELTRTVTVQIPSGLNIALDTTEMVIECSNAFTPPEARIRNGCAEEPGEATTEGTVDVMTPGEYTLTYSYPGAASVVLTVTVVDTTAPVINLIGDAAMTVECGGTYEAGATASDACDGDLTGGLIVGGAVDTAVPGEYTITYNVSDSAANAAVEVTRVVTVADTTAPVLELFGFSEVTVECGGVYLETGASAVDACEGNLTGNIVIGGEVDTAVPGEYIITYNVSDSAANVAEEITRTVTVADTLVPAITLVGSAEMVLDCNSVYTEQGATATDACDGDITGDVVVGGDAVNTASPGEYIITYDVSDSSANAAAQAIRTVTVLDNCDEPCDPDQLAPVITLTGDAVVTVECKGVYTEPGATATDNCDGSLTGSVIIGGDAVNTNVPGSYTITYNVTDSAGNNAAQAVRTVLVVDSVVPELALLGADTVRVECKSGYTDAGAMAVDTCTGNLTSAITVDNPVDPNVVGSYTVTYTVSDGSGNAATPLTRTVHVMDTIAPIMDIGELDESLIYDADGFLVLEAGTPFIDLEPVTYTATDICAGNLGLPQSVVEADTSVVLAWAWALDADGQPRWFNDVGTIRPVTFTYDEFTAEVGKHLLVYVALDGNGNSYPEVDEEGIPNIFDDEDNLDIFDEEGNLKVDYVRLVKVEDTTSPEISLVGGARLTVDCGVEFVDPGFDVDDNASGDIEVTYSGDPNVNVPGNYVRTYYAVDSEGNEQTLDRLIIVQNNCPIVYYTLDVDVVGDGTVSVTPAQDTYAAGSAVVLTAAPAYKSRFVNWSGAADGNGLEVTVVMDSDKSVLANFNPIVRLTTISTPPDGGTLVFVPEPLELARGDEVGAWVATYDTGAIVAVTVQPAERFKFRRWEGDIEEPEGGKCKIGCRRELETTITIELDRDKTVEAVFKRKLPWWVYVLIGIGVAGSIAAIAGG